jgi:predicted TIM-barrel fold metal-dependent hydrolase
MSNQRPVYDQNATAEAVAGEQWISADGHFAEPPDLFETKLPAKFRDQALKFPADKYYETGHHLRAGGWDPKERLKDMALDHTSAEVFYPTNGAQIWKLEDPELEAAHCRVYNDFMMEYCSYAPERLWGLAMLPMRNIDLAVEEMKRCIGQKGVYGVATWTCPPTDLPWTSDHYAKLWAAAADLDITVSMHANHGPYTGRGRDPNVTPWEQAARYDVMRPLGDIIASGVLERYPNLRVVVAEYGVGWMPFWAQELDYYYMARRTAIQVKLPRPPSEYIFDRLQVYGTFISDIVGGTQVPLYGKHNYMWTSDYPHPACIWPNSAEYIAQDLGHLRKEDREPVIATNAARIYNNGKMPPPADPPGEHQTLEKWVDLHVLEAQATAEQLKAGSAFKVEQK